MNNYLFNKLLLISIFIVSRFYFAGCTEKNKSQDDPNIIYVLADDLGYGVIGAFNENCKIQTPNLDRMAADGIRFTDAHTSSAVCTPTRYGILTGRYSWRSVLKSGVLTGKSKALIPKNRSTVASMLKDHGYKTAFVGKWHLGWDWGLKNPEYFGGEGWDENDFANIDFSKEILNSPNDLGFDYFYAHSGSLDMAPYVYVENGQVTQIPDTVTVSNDKFGWWRKGPTASDFVHEEVTPEFFNRAISYIKNNSKGRTPFFLYLALPSPHTPILPTEQWKGKSGLNPYGDFVMMIDSYMGELLDAIENAGISENTLVIFTSDNGCSPAANINELKNMGHNPSYIFRGFKADIYEGGHRIPFIAKWPARIKHGTISNEIICTTDLMATCAQIIDYPLLDNEAEDSYSLIPLLENSILAKPLREATVHHSIDGSFAIRKGDWKLIMCPGSGGWSFPTPSDKSALSKLPDIQLYNIKNDPSETNNMQGTYPKKVRELKNLLIKYIAQGRSTPGKTQINDLIDFDWPQINFIKQD